MYISGFYYLTIKSQIYTTPIQWIRKAPTVMIVTVLSIATCPWNYTLINSTLFQAHQSMNFIVTSTQARQLPMQINYTQVATEWSSSRSWAPKERRKKSGNIDDDVNDYNSWVLLPYLTKTQLGYLNPCYYNVQSLEIHHYRFYRVSEASYVLNYKVSEQSTNTLPPKFYYTV